MRIIAIDDEFFALENLRFALDEIGRSDELSCFSSGEEALLHLKNHPADIAFIDINMGHECGLEIARSVKEIAPQCLIVFLTGYDQYSFDALKIHVFDYLLKPIVDSELKRVINDAEAATGSKEKAILVKTFGTFDVYVNRECIHFQSQKSKELLAFLIDRRGSVTTREAGILFWPDGDFSRSRQSMLQTLIGKLLATLEEAGAGDIIIRERGSMMVNHDAIDCDLYKLLEGKPVGITPFTGEYMQQYSWAESTRAWLSESFLGKRQKRKHHAAE